MRRKDMKTLGLIIGGVAFYIWFCIKVGQFASGDWMPDIDDIEDNE